MSTTNETILVNGSRMTVAKFLEMDPNDIRTIDAYGCTSLTSLSAPAATRVYASGCTALTSLSAPAATEVNAYGCTALTSLSAPAATHVDARGCTSLPGYGGRDGRDYTFIGLMQPDGLHIYAGCRHFILTQARQHWGPGGKSDRPDCLDLVNKIARQFGVD